MLTTSPTIIDRYGSLWPDIRHDIRYRPSAILSDQTSFLRSQGTPGDSQERLYDDSCAITFILLWPRVYGRKTILGSLVF